MDIFRLCSGLRNRINELKGTSPFFLFQLILIFLLIFFFQLFQFLKVKLILVQYPRSVIIVKVRDNRRFWHNFILGHWETHGFITLKQIVNKGDTILDVGAWNGVYTLFLSKLVGKKGRIYSFEPDPIAMRLLKTNINLNKIKNAKLENLAVSISEGKETFHIIGNGGTSESHLKETLEINRSGITTKKLLINTTTLDNFCHKNNIVPNGIKIDVEGAESLVFKGLSNIISKYKPWVLLEFHGRFMSDEERIINWENITKKAKKVIFIGGICKIKYRFGQVITHKTEFLKDDYSVIHVLIFY